MTRDTRRPEPAWTPHPGPEITLMPASPGAVRTGHNSVQWYLDSDHNWHPVVHDVPTPIRQVQHEREAGT